MDLAIIREYCPCYASTSDAVLQRDVDFVVSMLSRMSGWQLVGNETFLKLSRTQIEQIDVKCCDCEILKIPLKYGQVDTNTIVIKVIREGNSSIEYANSPTGFYSPITQTYNFNTLADLDGNGTKIPRCCKSKCEDWYIKLSYTAGYDPVPAEVYNIVCLMLNAYALLKLGCSDAQVSNSACSKMDAIHYASYLKRNKVGEDEQEFMIVDNSSASLPIKINEQIERMIGVIRNVYRVDSSGIITAKKCL